MRNNKDTYNYKEVFNEPLKVKKIFMDYSLPYFVSIARIGYFFLILVLLLIFLQPIISFIDSVVPGSKMAIYLFVPFYGSKYIMKISPDGKGIPTYLKDLAVYYVTIGIPKKRYYHDEPLQFYKARVKLTPITILEERKESDENVVEVATEETT